MSSHDIAAHVDDVRMGSERAFGFVFAAVFTGIAVWPLLHGAEEPRWWALGIAAVFIVTGLGFPNVLRPLNKLWFKFGMLLHAVINPLVMGFIFFLVVTPTAILRRAMGKDTLALKPRRKVSSYWILREPPGPTPESMKNQF